MVIRVVCPRCQSSQYKKNGHTHTGKQHHYCHDWGRQCVQCGEPYRISPDKRGLSERLLVERISLGGICRAVGVTLKWLLRFHVQCVAALPAHLHVQPVTCTHNVMIQRLEVEANARASVVQQKANKQWIWIAIDVMTRQSMACHVGDRSRTSARRLWAKIPQAYRQHATFYTDQDVGYDGVIPVAQPQAIRTLARQTTHIKRCNTTLRQRVARLVRDAVSFSKTLVNHSGAIKLFICHYNLTKAAASSEHYLERTTARIFSSMGVLLSGAYPIATPP